MDKFSKGKKALFEPFKWSFRKFIVITAFIVLLL
jgi:hypothetical protein